ncbi:MAG: HIT domain-containing protein [Sulfolobus sp.]|nr:HIT domain-containing protein [Sulfolobus sp.]
MKILWAPWRYSYVTGSTENKKKYTCLFCDIVKENNDKENYILYRSKYAYIMLNAYPYNTAHVMIVPYRHVASIDSLSSEEGFELFSLLNIVIKAIREVYNPHGFNIGINMGKVAGAGIEQHVHVHVVPRWEGDANFMPLLAGTKVMPESLNVTYEKLKPVVEKYTQQMKWPSIAEK